MITASAWLEARDMGAPPELAERVRRYLVGVTAGAGVANQLAGAALAALSATLSASGDRSTALDLLAADALITLALLAQAELDPAHLAVFAGELCSAGASLL